MNNATFMSSKYLIILMLIGLMGCVQTPESNTENNTWVAEESPMTLVQDLEFQSLDGLVISAKLYKATADAPVIVLCHQARFNKFSYDGIAPKLVDMGFTCLAIDQRSGGPIGSTQNETKNRAVAQQLPTAYLDAEPDIIAAVNYAYEKFNKPIILWGSSYSSTLALYIAMDNPKVAGVISFSPGNYFKDEKGSLTELLVGFKKPFFLTSSKREATGVSELIKQMELNDQQIQFIPEGSGHHGSRALWENQDGGQEYWDAITSFLSNIKNN